MNGLLALSMYVVLAVGQLSLGQAAFMGLGAYSSALMTLSLGWPFWAVLPLSVIAPGGVRAGDRPAHACGCPASTSPSPPSGWARCCAPSTSTSTCSAARWGCPASRSSADDGMIYGLLAAAIAALWLVGRSGIGRAMEAMREDETAAAVMGVNLLPLQDGRAAGLRRTRRVGRLPERARVELHRAGGVWLRAGGDHPVLRAARRHRHAARPGPRRVHPHLAAGVAARPVRYAAGAERGDHRAGRAVPARRACCPGGCGAARRDGARDARFAR